MQKLRDGDICPLLEKNVMIRSENGCLMCKYKNKLVSSKCKLYVVCSFKIINKK